MRLAIQSEGDDMTRACHFLQTLPNCLAQRLGLRVETLAQPGQFIHLQLPPSDQLKEMPFTRITSTLFQTPYNETSDLAYVATSGQHSLWLQVPSDRDMSKVVKFTFDSSPEPTVSLDTLLPPIPLLPFRPSTCTTLSLDEGTGRICVGLFNGSLYVLSL